MCRTSDTSRQDVSEFNNKNDDNGEENNRTPSPWLQASLISKAFFTWPLPLLKLGLSRPLEDSDLPDLPAVDRSTYNRDYFENLWKNEKKRNPKNPSLHRVLLKDFFFSTWGVQPVMGLSAICRVVQSIALGFLIESFQTNKNGYTWASVLVFCSVVVLFEHHHNFFFLWRKGMQLRTASVANIFAKSLRLSSIQQADVSLSGNVMNLASNDVERFMMASLFISHIFWAPVQSIAVLGVGLWLIGYAFAAGFALLVVIVVPLQSYLAGRFIFYRRKIAAITDRRVNLVSQAVYGTRVMKMSGWEWQFLEKIALIREEEISQIRKANYLKAVNEGIYFSANIVISLVICIVHVGMGETLNPRIVFTVMGLVNVVQLEMTKHISLGIMGVSECYVSISRIQKFLEHSERSYQKVERYSENSSVLELNDVSCNWKEAEEGNKDDIDTTSKITALSNITISFKKGSLTCIIGSVGSGKSALLQTIVGELPISSGTLHRNYKSLSYAPQDSFVMDGTVRENILMGLKWREDWYREVVRATGLDVDFQQFRNGDSTVVGDRGVQCSGGQRARIGLARALYRDSDVLVCDDPLSAVDVKVGRLIFFEALKELAVNRGKCVILVTHQLQFIRDSTCVLMSDGKISHFGSFNDCIRVSGGGFISSDITDHDVDSLAVKNNRKNEEKEPHMIFPGKDKTVEEDGQEMNVQGLVRVETFVKYCEAMGGTWVGIAVLILFAITQASSFVSIAILGRWAERDPVDQSNWDILALVIGMGILVVSLGFFRAILSFYLTVKASKNLHDSMARALLRAKMDFFDTNSLGRILNRFSADVGSNDDLLPHTLFEFLVLAFLCFGAIITAIVILPYTLIVVPLLSWYFLSVRRTFVTSSRELKRIEGLARSPIFALLSESLSGIATIRTNDALQYFEKKFVEMHDSHSRAFFAFIASSRWVGFQMESVAVIFLAVCSMSAVLFNSQGWLEVDPAILGLAFTSLVQIAGIFQWCIRQSAEVINQMVSVERVLGFANLPSEADLKLDSDKDLEGWPHDGSIIFEDLKVRYRPTLPPSLENISFEIPSGARVGVVGRTGSGKSTLIQTIFRLLETENGTIRIAGVDIQNIGLHTLRTRLSVIPQVPVLFSGCSIRENLDPFSKHSDETLEGVLCDVNMWEVIQNLPKGLNSMVAEGGSNFSMGQRQLLCLARAILRKNRVLILDEPTANVDRKTDQLLQEALNNSFPDATIISVAHRLDTVIDSDFILVLGQGKLLEYGPPVMLLKKKDGHFSSMVQETGEVTAENLRRRALEKKLKF